MSEACPGAPEHRKAHSRLCSARPTRWLGYAATPIFAMMAVLTAAGEMGVAGSLCSGGMGTLQGGMVPMYLLMSVFHASPWLERVGWHGRPR